EWRGPRIACATRGAKTSAAARETAGVANPATFLLDIVCRRASRAEAQARRLPCSVGALRAANRLALSLNLAERQACFLALQETGAPHVRLDHLTDGGEKARHVATAHP